MAKARTVTSQGQLAVAVGRSQQTVSKWIRHPTWPFGPKGPWDVARVKAWAAGLQDDRAADGAGLGDARKVRLARENETMLLTRTRREKLQGQLVGRELLDGALRGLARMFVGALDDVERSVGLECEGLSNEPRAEVDRVLSRRIRDVRKRLASETVIQIEHARQAVAAAEKPAARGRPSGRR